MEIASAKELKRELANRDQKDLVNICLRLSRFKKENKELLNYLLFDSENESYYVQNVKDEIDEQFDQVNRKSYYYIKKSVRKILKNGKKYIRYSPEKETEVSILLHFCQRLKEFKPSIKRNTTLRNIFLRQIELVKKAIAKLHEDLQYDYSEEVKELETID